MGSTVSKAQAPVSGKKVVTVGFGLLGFRRARGGVNGMVALRRGMSLTKGK